MVRFVGEVSELEFLNNFRYNILLPRLQVSPPISTCAYAHMCLCAGQIVLPPSLPGQPRGQRKNVCDKKRGGGTRKKGEISDYVGRGKEKR